MIRFFGYALLVLLAMAGFCRDANATHALGADLTYECLGGDQYLLRLAFYRDCNGISAPTSVTIDITGCGNSSVTLTLQPAPTPSPPFDQYLAPYEVPVYCQATNCGSGSLPGLQEYIYEGVTTLAPCANWNLSYQLCCRSAAITTIVDPDDQDIYVEAFLNNLAAPCNSSPAFDVPSRGFLCVNQLNTILGTATDVDGDQLVYSLYTPMVANNATVTYLGGYSATNPLTNTGWSFVNGVIETTPTAAGQVTVMGILIEEYRNGVLIGSIMRDMQIRMVDNCPQNPGNDFDINQDGIFDEDTIVLCADNPVQLDVYLNNTVPGRTYGMTVENMQDFIGANFTTTPDPAQPGSVIGHFTWTPTQADIGTQQTVIFTAYDDNCPIVGYANFTYQFIITGLELDVGIDTVAISCTDSTQMIASASQGTPPYTYLWDNGSTDPARWVTAGTFWVTVTDSEGCTGSDTINVYYIDDPVAQFTVTNACVDSNIVLNDMSYSNYPVGFPAVNIVDWNWDFGDGATESGTPNPTHAYTQTGQFTVQLIATNDLGCHDTTTLDVVSNPGPVALFSAPPVCEGSAMAYLDQSTITTGQITAWNWNFGQAGATSVVQNPNHQYTTWGYFDVTLTAVSDSGCSATVTTPVYVAPYPTANFTPTDVCLNEVTQFTDQSSIPSGDVTAWSWDFANGTGSSAVQDPVYTFTDYGTFDVELIAFSDSGCTDTIVLPVTVHPMPIAEFTFDTACAELPTTFLDASTISSGINTSWSWSFGDGGASAVQNPTHTYAYGGTYTVTLIVTSDLGCPDTIAYDVLVYPKPTADFTDQNSCLNLPSQFTSSSIVDAPGVIDQWNWDFGNGTGATDENPSYVYPNSGLFDVTLIATTSNGCSDTATHSTEVYVLPNAMFNVSDVCLGESVFYDNQSNIAQGTISSYFWDYGFGGNTSSTQYPTGIYYPNAGDYYIDLIVTSALGCADTLTDTLEIFPLPTASFTFENVCWPEVAQFTDLSAANGTYPIDEWRWGFGDGQLSFDQNPNNNYQTWGTYEISLLISNSAGCEDDTSMMGITIHPEPLAAFPTDIGFCQQDTGFFESLSTVENNPNDSLTDWWWNFGDGHISTDPTDVHHYAEFGFYPVTLAVETNHGCIDSVTQNVEVFPHPIAGLGPGILEGCQPFEVQFNDESTIEPGYMITSWSWNLGDGNDAVMAPDPIHIYHSPNLGPFDAETFTVSLEVTSIEGCKDSQTIADMVTIHPTPDALFSATPDPVDMLNPTMYFEDRSSDNVVDWIWELDHVGTFSNQQHPSFTFADTGTFWVTQYVATEFGCADTIAGDVVVVPHFTFYVPNAFTPNEDGVNDHFFGTGTYMLKYQMQVFDRWGELLFYTENPEEKWDGKFRGAKAQQGQYVYRFYIVDWSSLVHEYYGSVFLTR